MCLLFLVFGEFPVLAGKAGKGAMRRSLILVSVRDEDFYRETARGCVCEKGTYAPQDLEAGGTWLAFNQRNQRFAVILNNDDISPEGNNRFVGSTDVLSRGILPKMFTESTKSATVFKEEVEKMYNKFNGFSLIFGDDKECHYISNRCSDSPVCLEPNVLHGFSNGAIYADPESWPRLTMGKNLITSVLPDPSLVSSEDFVTCRNSALRLLEAFKSHENEEPESKLRSARHESLILKPFTCPESDHFYGTRTLTIASTFKYIPVEDGTETKHQGEHVAGGAYVVESNYDLQSFQWSEIEYTLS